MHYLIQLYEQSCLSFLIVIRGCGPSFLWWGWTNKHGGNKKRCLSQEAQWTRTSTQMDGHSCPHRGQYFPLKRALAPTQHTDKWTNKNSSMGHIESFPQWIWLDVFPEDSPWKGILRLNEFRKLHRVGFPLGESQEGSAAQRLWEILE